MTDAYALTFQADPDVTLAALKVPPPFAKVRGQTRSKLLRLLHCVLLALGGLGFGYGVSDLLTGTPTLLHWSTAIGVALSYLAIFGSIYISLPTFVRQILATRAHQGDVTLHIDADGVQSRAEHYQSRIGWAGFEGIGRSKLAMLLWFGGNRISIPFTAFDGPVQIDVFEADVKTWIGAAR